MIGKMRHAWTSDADPDEISATIKDRIGKPWKNRWAALCTYLNLRPNGAIITRQQIMNYMRPGRDFSIDTYRNYLTKAQFLAIIGNGKYEKVKDIPIGISRRDVQRLGYDVSKYNKGW